SLTHTPTHEIYTLSLHDALPIYDVDGRVRIEPEQVLHQERVAAARGVEEPPAQRVLHRQRQEQDTQHGRGQDLDDAGAVDRPDRSEEHTSELQSLTNLVCRLLLE